MRILFTVFIFLQSIFAQAQYSKQDSILISNIDYEDFFDELEKFIDSLTTPRSFGTVHSSFATGFFNFYDENEGNIARRKLVAGPAAGYYHRNGLGISVQGAAMVDKGALVPFQLAATGSYDYLQNRSLMTGVSYTRIFTRDSISFYTPPLSNEVTAYFMYRKSWLKPMLAASYGWGSRRSFEEVRNQYAGLRLPLGFTSTETVESIYDLTLTVSVRRDFYWLDVVLPKDYIRFSPLLSLAAGTERFGFDQTNNTYLARKKGGREMRYQSRTHTHNSQTGFQPLSLSAGIRTEWSKGYFFVQPQLYAGYRFGPAYKKLISSVSLNTGIIF